MARRQTRNMNRAARLEELEVHLVSLRGQPARVAELAERFEVDRSTLHRMINDLLDRNVPVCRDKQLGVWIERDYYPVNVKLTLHELLAIFLAARLLARYSDKPNPHAVKALRKLSAAFAKVSHQISTHIARTSEKLDRPMNEGAQNHLRALETITRAWADGTRVRMFSQDKPDVERLFEPYFIEPSAVGYSSYVIGFDHYRKEVRTFKIERLARVYATNDTYTIPSSFDPYQKLAGAWGINWGKSDETTEVVLRFSSGRPAERVRETHWHESQRIDDLLDGGCRLTIRVGSTQEMKPWIRQWGPDCECEQPEALRREIAAEMALAAAIYESTESTRVILPSTL